MHIAWGREILYLVLSSSSYSYLLLIHLCNRQMVRNTRNSNGDGSNTTNGEHSQPQNPNNININAPQLEQVLAMQAQLMQTMMQTFNNLQQNQQAPPPPSNQNRLGEFLRTRPPTLSQVKDPLEADDWLKAIEKKLLIAQCSDKEKVLFAAHQLFGPSADWWDAYCSAHPNVEAITWNEFKTSFRTHFIPTGLMMLKRKEFTELKQGSMTVTEYLNRFTQLSRYAPEDVSTDARKQYLFLNAQQNPTLALQL